MPGAEAVLIGERFSRLEANRLYEKELRELSRSPSLRDRVRWLGFLEEIEHFACDLDLLVHPAHQEPLACVLLEASSMEIPVVATRVGGSPEIVRHGETGILVDRGDDVALGRAIAAFYGNRTGAREMGKEGRSRCLKAFSLEVATDLLIEAYDECIRVPA